MADSFLKLISGATKSTKQAFGRKKFHESHQQDKIQLIAPPVNFFGNKTSSQTSQENIASSASTTKGKKEKYVPPKRTKKDLKAVQREHAIDVQGDDIPPLVCTFEEMQYYYKFPKYILNNLLAPVSEGGFQFREPTPIQMQAIPALLSNREVLAFAPTGSGKTLSFVLPIVKKLLSSTSPSSSGTSLVDASGKPQQTLPYHALVLSPTRELSLQTYRVIKKLIRRNTTFTEDGKVVSDDHHEDDKESSVRLNVSLMTQSFKKRTRQNVRKTRAALKVANKVDSSSHASTTTTQAPATTPDQKGDTHGEDEASNDDDDDDDDDDVHEDDDEEVSEPSDNDDDIKEVQEDMKSKYKAVKTILVSTPMMLISLLSRCRASLPFVECIVIDEADRLFDMGFLEQMNTILSKCTNRSILKTLVSATISGGVEEIAKRFLRSPIRITVGGENVAQMLVRQQLKYVGNEDGKLFAFNQMILEGLPIPMLVFVQSKERAIQFYEEYRYKKINVGLIHSDLTEAERLETIKNFRIGKVWVLVCTDLLSRGVDFQHVKCVINYDFPQSEVSYIHRIGRTGRGGNKGIAITYVTEEDKTILRNIAEIANNSRIAQLKHEQQSSSSSSSSSSSQSTIDKLLGSREDDVPSWMLKLYRARARDVIELSKRAPLRDDIRFVKQSVRDKRRFEQEKVFHLKMKNLKKLGLNSRNETGQRLSDRIGKPKEKDGDKGKDKASKSSDKNKNDKRGAKSSSSSSSSSAAAAAANSVKRKRTGDSGSSSRDPKKLRK